MYTLNEAIRFLDEGNKTYFRRNVWNKDLIVKLYRNMTIQKQDNSLEIIGDMFFTSQPGTGSNMIERFSPCLADYKATDYLVY